MSGGLAEDRLAEALWAVEARGELTVTNRVTAFDSKYTLAARALTVELAAICPVVDASAERLREETEVLARFVAEYDEDKRRSPSFVTIDLARRLLHE